MRRRRFSKSGGTLKRSTGDAKIRHMRMVMEFKERLKTPTDRDGKLIEISILMQGRFKSRFDPLYDSYRNTDIPTYEKKIANKLKYERARARRIAREQTGETK